MILWSCLCPSLLYSSLIGASCLSKVQFLRISKLGFRSKVANAAEEMFVDVVALVFARMFEGTREN